jgi:tetratricopeptide (TPR) repeat protein
MLGYFMMFERLLRKENRQVKDIILLSIILTLVMFLREVGIMLFGATVLFFLVRREWRQALLISVVPAVLYLLWFIRNEVLIAAIEQPALRNTRLLFEHTFTPLSASLLEEFLARFVNNSRYYIDALPSLLVAPQYLRKVYPVVTGQEGGIRVMTDVLRFLIYPLITLQIILVVLGIRARRREERALSLLGFFVLLLFGLLLLYPILDLRFLFPLSLFILFYSMAGWKVIRDRFFPAPSKLLRGTLAGGMVYLFTIVPNSVWTLTFVEQNLYYGNFTRQHYERREVPETDAELYLKPFRYVGEWLKEHTSRDAVIATRWKELALWMDGRKIVQMGPATKVEMVDRLLRDHDATHFVLRVGKGGLSEFEYQLATSRSYDFRPVYRVGFLEVLEVIPKNSSGRLATAASAQDASAKVVLRDYELKRRRSFREGIRLLESGKFQEAHARFKALWDETGGSAHAVILTGVALGFAGQREQADAVFRAFLEQPQAGDFLDEAWFHRELLARLHAVTQDTSRTSRAFIYYGLSVNYWEAGFRARAVEMLQQSLQEDSCYQPALNFGVHLGLQAGDTTLARSFVLDRICGDAPTSPEVLRSALMAYIDSIRTSRSAELRAEYQFEVAGLYERLGFPETALAELHCIVRDDPKNVKTLTTIATMYERRNRRALALRKWREVFVADPGSRVALQKMSELFQRP